MPIEIPANLKPLLGVLLIIAVIAASISREILLSVTFLFGLLFLIAVVAASYAGTMMALERFFEQKNRR